MLLQLVWKAPVDESRRRVLSEHLGAKPMMVVEWKRLLRESGVRDVHTEDWSDEETAFRPTVVKPFPDFAELFSLTEKIGILRRAWRRWGWRGVYAVLTRESEVHKLLTNERILALDLLRGRKDPADGSGRADAPSDARSARGREDDAVPASVAALPHPADEAEAAADGDGEEGSAADTSGLPLFGHEKDPPTEPTP